MTKHISRSKLYTLFALLLTPCLYTAAYAETASVYQTPSGIQIKVQITLPAADESASDEPAAEPEETASDDSTPTDADSGDDAAPTETPTDSAD